MEKNDPLPLVFESPMVAIPNKQFLRMLCQKDQSLLLMQDENQAL
jgi:hypothetical protein